MSQQEDVLSTVTSTAVVIAALLVIGCLVFAVIGYRHGETMKALEMKHLEMKQFAANLQDHVPPQSAPPCPSPPTPRQCGAVNPLYASKMNPLHDSDDDLDELHGPEAPSKVTQQPNGMCLGGPAAAKVPGHYQVVDSPPGLPFKANSMYIAADTQDFVEPSDDEYDEVQTNDDADEVAGYLEVDGWANDTYDPTGVHDLRPGAVQEQQWG